MTTISIRPATAKDTALIFRFINELADYEDAGHEVITTAAEIEATLFASESTTKAVICNINDEPAGFAVYFFNYSTWLGKHGLYLEDLYVSPENRGSGAGKALLKYLAQVAVSMGCGRFEWNVLDWNEPAIQFYKSMGAKPQNEWVGYRLSGKALEKLATTD